MNTWMVGIANVFLRRVSYIFEGEEADRQQTNTKSFHKRRSTMLNATASVESPPIALLSKGRAAHLQPDTGTAGCTG